MKWLSFVALAVASWLVAASVAHAEQPVEPKPEAQTTVDPNSPRAAVSSYLDLARRGRSEQAASYLQLGNRSKADGPVLAERLRFVLERHDVDPEELSPAAEGDPDDQLPPGVDRVAVITDEAGREEDVLIKRVTTRTGQRWLFPRQSVRRIDAWYYNLREHPLLEALPAPLHRSGPLNLLWWQWAAFLLLIAAGWILGTLLGKITIRALKEVTERTPPEWDDEIVAQKRGPITLLWAALICWALLPLIDLYPAADTTAKTVLRMTVYLALFWAFTRAADVVAANAGQREWARRNPASRALIRLGARMLKVLVIGLGIVSLLSQLGYRVESLIAGLGVGGLAFALAAQRTVGNLFGALSLAVDQPLREGDLVRVGDQQGTVEAVGLWSTRIRSQDRTIITIPNGLLAERQIESFAVRDRMLLECTIRLVYGIGADQLRRLLADFERVLRANDKVWPDSLHVHLAAFGDSSLDVEITAWLKTTTQAEYCEVREQVLFALMKAIDDAGSAFAFPTQTVHVAGRLERGD